MFDHDEDEVQGEPAFELLVREGRPIVAGSYFMHPPLREQSARYDDGTAGRVLVTTTDGSIWYADDVPQTGTVTVRLHRLPQG